MIYSQIDSSISDILADTKKIEYQGILFYLIDKSHLDKILLLELEVREKDIELGIEKRNHFYDYAKIINPKYPAFKYTLSMKHKKKEIFDPQKVKKALPAEFEIWKNRSRAYLRREIDEPQSNISEQQAKRLIDELESKISRDEEKFKRVLADFDSYDVVISTFEHYTYYPALYYVMELGDGKTKASDTHLRKDVPNLLWFRDERPFNELRANDKMSRIIQTFDRFCDTIYAKKR